MLPDQFQRPGGPLPGQFGLVTGGSAPRARARRSGRLILVPGGGTGSAPSATAGAISHRVVAGGLRSLGITAALGQAGACARVHGATERSELHTSSY